MDPGTVQEGTSEIVILLSFIFKQGFITQNFKSLDIKRD